MSFVEFDKCCSVKVSGARRSAAQKKVRVQCVDDAKSGPYSEFVSQRTMPRLPEPPTNVRFVSGTVVVWDLGELNDCIFTR